MDSFKFYAKKPTIGSIVNCKVIQQETNHVLLHLVDYDLQAIITWKDITKKKYSRKLKSFAKKGSLFYAKIDTVIEDDISVKIRVVKSYLTDTDQNVIDFKNEQYKNKKIYSLVKQLENKFNINFMDFWKKKIHKMDNIKESNNSLYDFIQENIDIFTDELDIEQQNYINNYFDKNNNKQKNIQKTEIGIISNKGIEFTKNVISNSLNDNNNIKITVSSTPYFMIESNNKNTTDEEHFNFIKEIKSYENNESFFVDIKNSNINLVNEKLK